MTQFMAERLFEISKPIRNSSQNGHFQGPSSTGTALDWHHASALKSCWPQAAKPTIAQIGSWTKAKWVLEVDQEITGRMSGQSPPPNCDVLGAPRSPSTKLFAGRPAFFFSFFSSLQGQMWGWGKDRGFCTWRVTFSLLSFRKLEEMLISSGTFLQLCQNRREEICPGSFKKGAGGSAEVLQIVKKKQRLMFTRAHRSLNVQV